MIAFYVGLPETEEDRLASLFEVNGFSTNRRNAHLIADEFAWRRLAGEPVRSFLQDYNLIVGLATTDRPARPSLTENKELDHLLQSFPDAVLIFNEINEEQWIRRMQCRDNGAAAVFQASWLGISKDDLPAVWSVQLSEQRERLLAAQDKGATVVFLKADGSLSDWQVCLSPWFELPRYPAKETSGGAPESKAGRPRYSGRRTNVPQELTSVLARHCLGNQQPTAVGNAVFSAMYAEWDGAEKVTGQNGKNFPVRFGYLGGALRCIAKPGVKKAVRVEGVINEAMSNGTARPLRMDMQDCRLYGTADGEIPAKPVLTYCRRVAARNVILWPLPHYHSIGAVDFVGATPDDDILFKDKLDILFWRGAVSGHCSNVAQGVFSNPVWSVADRLMAQPDRADLWTLLENCTRVSVLRRHCQTPGMDLRFVSSPTFQLFSKHPSMAPLFGQFADRPAMLRHRYILSMRGNDTGSNFISAANSNSVVLKEEDGWELFYSPLFRPWESYIPLTAGLHDLEEKLDWARRNPVRCSEISAAAREACSYLAVPAWRQLLLRTIADSI